jgi:CheY-like chemotaxis protein
MNGISMPRPWQASSPAGQLAQRLDRARRVLRSTFAFAGSVESRARPTARAIGVDVSLAAAAALAMLVLLPRTSTLQPAVLQLGAAPAALHGATSPNLADWRQLPLAAVSAAPLALRRLWPLAAFWLILGIAVATPGYRETVVTVIVVVVAAYSALAYSRFYGAAMLCMPAAGLLVTGTLHGTMPQLRDSSATLLLLGPILVAGNAMHVWRRQAGDSQARLDRLQAEHEAATLRALDLERARIASELHDVVTHNVSVMIVQAGAARQVLAAAPDQATSAMLAVEASGRAAMTELRHLLGLLGPADPADQGTAGGCGPAGQHLRPQPGPRAAPVAHRRGDGGRAAGRSGHRRSAARPAGWPGPGGVPGGPGGTDQRDQARGQATDQRQRRLPRRRPSLGGGRRRTAGRSRRSRRGRRARDPRRRAGPARPARADGGVRRRTGGGAAAGRRLAGPGPHPGLPGADRAPGPVTGPTGPVPGPIGRVTDAAGPAGEPAPPRVVIADDQTLVRSGFRMILGAAGIPVVAEAADGQEAVAAVLKHRPDVVLMDIRMPEMDGLEATRQILAARPGRDSRIIMLTTFDFDQYVYAALNAGASGFLLKDVSPRTARRRGAHGPLRRRPAGAVDHPQARGTVRGVGPCGRAP